VNNVVVTGTTLAEPAASWTAPVGEGKELVASYDIRGFAEWGVGRTRRTHTVNYTVPASETSILMPGLVTGRSYTLTITPVDASGNLGLANSDTVFASIPALPQIRWSVNGFSGGVSTPAPVVAAQSMEIVLIDESPDSSSITLVSGPAGLTFDAVTKIASWTPTAADVTTGFTSTDVTFEAVNSVGSTVITVPIRVFFSGAVKNLSAIKYGNTAAIAEWDPPTDNATPIDSYQVTRHWTWSGRKRSASWTIAGDATSVTVPLAPTGAVVHKSVTITPIDANGNLGVAQNVAYGQRVNDLAPIANDDAYSTAEDSTLVVDYNNELRRNDVDTANKPVINPLTVQLVTPPSPGQLTLEQNGSFTYVPDADFTGADTFMYRLHDGKFHSNVATVTVNVTPVNDAPSALDDYYSVNQDTLLDVNTVVGVQANDGDVDGDALDVAVLSNPTDGTLLLNRDGSFAYTPDPGFVGTDSFTYIANDSRLDSRAATVTIAVNLTTPPTEGTRFYVVDYSSRSTFEYDTQGAIVDSYALPQANKKPLGVAANVDGSLVWTIDKQKRVFIYNDAGTELGMWVPQGLTKPDGIATDGSDVWIVDRGSDRVFKFAEGATRRNGTAAATSSFALAKGNKNPKGITTDGVNIWTVNNTGNVDRVFKYDTFGTLLGNWTIDVANAKPTGITIDPNNVDDIWIVDKGSDSVYRYEGGAALISDSAVAVDTFALAPTNTNPQGIADPSGSSATDVDQNPDEIAAAGNQLEGARNVTATEPSAIAQLAMKTPFVVLTTGHSGRAVGEFRTIHDPHHPENVTSNSSRRNRISFVQLEPADFPGDRYDRILSLRISDFDRSQSDTETGDSPLPVRTNLVRKLNSLRRRIFRRQAIHK